MLYNKLRECRKGFTLIEIMLSIVILITGLVGVILVIPMAQKLAGRSALATRSAIIASEKIEELKAKGYDELISQATWSGNADPFSWEATISDVEADDFEMSETTPTDKFIKIDMTVTYKTQGKQRTDTFTTFYSEL
jgi:type II secretory pathway pseudopilin PulG